MSLLFLSLSDVLIVLNICASLFEELLQEVDRSVHINSTHESHQLEEKHPCREREQERAVGENIFDLARDDITHQVIRILDILHQELVEFVMAENLGADTVDFLQILSLRDFSLLIKFRAQQKFTIA